MGRIGMWITTLMLCRCALTVGIGPLEAGQSTVERSVAVSNVDASAGYSVSRTVQRTKHHKQSCQCGKRCRCGSNCQCETATAANVSNSGSKGGSASSRQRHTSRTVTVSRTRYGGTVPAPMCD